MTAVSSFQCFAAARRRPSVDWFMVVVELESVMSLRDIGQLVGVSKGTISYWKAEGEPKHCDGQNLIALYRQTFPARSTPMKMVKNLNGT